VKAGVAVLILVLSLLAAPLAAEAQQAGRVYRIGILTLSVASSTPIFEGFREGLREHGYVEGRNIALEFRFAQGSPERLATMAAELVHIKVDVIIVTEASWLRGRSSVQLRRFRL
jgi:putative ABC transport system substrate-binding protein